ncbi:N-acetylneuraminate synthase [Lacrimispora defluvii]|uniref:N-acetylneuraminate synthase n=1 Tax=Lacrimispora defluvii TaxID=2719233 RepID=A0ABX1VV65_9FIRM|nr:N-acetylneuraminate synthase [Lacrimispora defluvii]NNJ32231.1 N-acetylneuraminate synthase [Lacrimispora defluvii]
MSKIMIIAEAGVNHNGDLSIARQLIDAACAAGADAVKFQTFRAELLATPKAKKADYQFHNTGTDNSQFEMLKELELSWKDFKLLSDYCTFRGIRFLSSPFDENSMEYLDSIGMEIIKIPSGEITNYCYLKKAASLKKPVILSTGMSTPAEIRDALKLLDQSGQDITLLHCSSIYPTPMEDVNLNAMITLREMFHKKTGYSDHTAGIEVAVAAAALGACVIEKHLTLDKTMPGPDHRMSLEPDEFKHMADSVRNIEKAMGNGIKAPAGDELKNRDHVRKFLVAAKDIPMGEPFTLENLCAKRCSPGISPMKLPQILGTLADRNYGKDDKIGE